MVENISTVQETLLGFDAREYWLDPETRWTKANRQLYLLREDRLKPLSIDTWVWPSIFDWGNGMSYFKDQSTFNILPGPQSDWGKPRLWESLDDMQHQINTYWIPSVQSYNMVAVSWFSTPDYSGPNEVWPNVAPLGKAPIDLSWKLLGLDIGDGAMISGLSNCGYNAEEAEQLRLFWSNQLNDHHLFTNLHQANDFRAMTEQRVPEHAPFFVYGLYQVQPIGE